MRSAPLLLSIGLSRCVLACTSSPPREPLVVAPPVEQVSEPTSPAPIANDVRRVGGEARKSVAVIHTSLGRITCALFADRAPRTVENFVGLATGTKPWRDPKSEAWVERPAYHGTMFHRVIPGFIIQGGDPKGDGSGEPGYVFDDEVWTGATHDRAGLLCMANRGKHTNGMQFFITDGPAPRLDDSYTIFGECRELELIHAIASVPREGERPRTKVEILAVDIE